MNSDGIDSIQGVAARTPDQMGFVADGLAMMAPITALPRTLQQAFRPIVEEPVVAAAETTYYHACVALHQSQAETLASQWGQDD